MFGNLRSPWMLPGALLCLVCGLLLWENLTLHFAQIEEILPSLQAPDLLRGKSVFLVLIALSLIFALLVAGSLPWGKLWKGLNRPGRIAASSLIFGLSFIPLFWLQFGGAAWLILLFLGASFLLSGVGLLVVVSWLSDHLKPPDIPSSDLWVRLHPYLPAVLLFGAALYFSHYCFDFIPHVEDSIAQILQARIFAQGQASADPFLPREFFFFGFMVDVDRWFSQYPPGHPLILALGVLTGAPHLINPLLGLASIILFYLLVRDRESEKAARWGAWAMALSPYVIFMSSEFMNHSTALAASLLGWLGLIKAEKGRTGWRVLAGLSFGTCLATRPLEGAIFALIGGIYLLSSFGGLKMSAFRKALPYSVAFLLAASLYPIHNALTTGHPLTIGYRLTWGGSGFGLGAVNWGPPHTFGYGLVNTFMSVAGLNVFLYEIPLPALLAVFLWAVWGPKLSRWDRAFLAAMILVPLGYLFYYFHDYCFGPRYYYVIAPMLIYFSIKGVRALYSRLVKGLEISPETARRGLIWAGILLLILQLFVALPYRASVYADEYWGTDNGPMTEARRLGLTKAIVFIENHPWEILQARLHSLGFIMGDAHRFMFYITPDGLDSVLEEMGVKPEDAWGAKLNLEELEKRIYAWHQNYMAAGHPPIDPWAEAGFYTYYSNGALHLDPRHREPEVILARDLGEHNRRLMDLYPDRKAYRYAYDPDVRRFRILPLTR